MLDLFFLLFHACRAIFTSPSTLALENVALRQQVNVLRRRCPMPVLTYIDRLFWVGNALCGRVIGTLIRDGLDHVIILDERHLLHILRQLVTYYHNDRTHLALGKDCPIHRAVEPPEDGPIREIPILGGLHHRYTRKAA